MIREAEPVLDRHTQERLGRMLREKLDVDRQPTSSTEIEKLLASLRAADDLGCEKQRRS
ncbi:hypothetical protein [Chenggangzhangella methanolivorans]|uniref:Uncharacterized protein n=1 Tax=Chenggangzhangella methanolivorans TaxID=1437009 RepID=A0A9E6R9S9_9HYPH|nr:hypothetical protein [Chenggangzhangella methanolivorans]QZO00806.1 hypothetical protein K6K41_03820 [Chenggangzhangella methanolivorans]